MKGSYYMKQTIKVISCILTECSLRYYLFGVLFSAFQFQVIMLILSYYTRKKWSNGSIEHMKLIGPNCRKETQHHVQAQEDLDLLSSNEISLNFST